jgi:hypothetical protein
MNIVVSFESPEAPENLSKLFWECAFSNNRLDSYYKLKLVAIIS